MMKGQLEGESIKKFATGGFAILTLENEETGGRFTFRIRRKHKHILWVSVLSGSDNTSDYTYIGYVNTVKRIMKMKNNKSSETFSYFWRKIHSPEGLPACVRVYHEGRCGRCGRPLTVPESIKSGYGSVCAKLLGIK